MDEDVCLGFVEVAAGIVEETPVVRRDPIEAGGILLGGVRDERRVAAQRLPKIEELGSATGVHHHFLVIPAERDELTCGREANEPRNDGRRVDTPIDVFSERDHHVAVPKNPFPEEAEEDPSHLAVMCLKEAPSPAQINALADGIIGRERVRAVDAQLYVFYPDGIGRSRLTHAVIERSLGIRGTARNWNTVLKIAEVARGMDA